MGIYVYLWQSLARSKPEDDLESLYAVLEVTDPGLSPRRAGLLRHVVELRTAAATRQLRAGDIERKQHGEIMAGNMTMMREVMMCAKYSTVFKI